MANRLLLVALLFSVRCPEALAQVWTSQGPYGGSITALAIDPTTPSTPLRRDVRRRGLQVHECWRHLGCRQHGLTSPYIGVTVLVVDPTTPGTVYAGTGAGVFKSTNSGGSWAAANTGLTDLSIHALAIDPTAPTTLYAGTYAAVFKSTNSGGTWVAANTGLTDRSSRVGHRSYGPHHPLRRDVRRGLQVHELRWLLGRRQHRPDGPVHPRPGHRSHDPHHPLRRDGTRGVFKSTNSGGSWAAANTGLTDLRVRALAIDPTTPTTLYAGTDAGVFKSTNSGGTWAAASTGLGNLGVQALAIDPRTPATLYAGSHSGVGGALWKSTGVFKSTDSGGTWVAANAGLTNVSVQALAIDPTTAATVYAGTDAGVFKSTNSGGTWAAANTGLTNPVVEALAIDPTTPTTLYAGTRRRGLQVHELRRHLGRCQHGPARPRCCHGPGHRSHDARHPLRRDGSTGSSSPRTPAAPGPLPTRASSRRLSGPWPSIPRRPPPSTPGGTAGSTSPRTPAAPGPMPIRARPGHWPSIPRAPSTPGRTPGSSSPRTLAAPGANTGLTNLDVQALAIDPTAPATLYAGTTGRTVGGGPVFKSTNSGGTWADVAMSLPDLSVNALAIDPTTRATVYAATNRGVWQVTPSTPARYYTVPPCRLVDTRTSDGPTLAAGTTRTFTVMGKCGIPSTARTVSLNVTATGADSPGHLRLYPGGGALLATSNVNFGAGQTRASNGLSLLGVAGDLSIFSGQPSGSVDVIVDVNGYFE